MGKQITTKREDAESIVGESLAQDIEVNKTALDDTPEILVVKADPKEEYPEDHTGKDDCTCKACAGKKKEPMKSTVEEPVVVVETVEEKSALEVALDSFKGRVLSVKSLSQEDALKELQSDFESLAEVVRSEFAPTPAPTQVIASIDPALAELITSLKSAVESLAGTVSAISTDVTILKSQGAVVSKSPTKAETVTPRNIQVERSGNLFDLSSQKPISIKELARKSVY